jgi:hypothetical protein
MRENSSYPSGYYFGDKFLNAITKRNGSKVIEVSGIICL